MNVHEIITEKVIAALEAGNVPWQQPWNAGAGGAPRNLVSDKPYSGINPFLLQMHAYDKGLTSPYWLTFKQAKTLGGSVVKGAESALVVFFKMTEVADRVTGEVKSVPCLRFYRLFNLDQTDGVKVPKGRVTELPESAPVPPIDAAEAIVSGFVNPPRIAEGVPQAFYRASDDLLNMPKRDTFTGPEEWYSTLFHELGHSTAHKSRLDRDIANAFGSHDYGREELIAEMTSALLCNEAGITRTFDNSAAYLASWIKVIRSDAKALVTAGSKAQKAADLILGRASVKTAPVPQPEEVAA